MADRVELVTNFAAQLAIGFGGRRSGFVMFVIKFVNRARAVAIVGDGDANRIGSTWLRSLSESERPQENESRASDGRCRESERHDRAERLSLRAGGAAANRH